MLPIKSLYTIIVSNINEFLIYEISLKKEAIIKNECRTVLMRYDALINTPRLLHHGKPVSSNISPKTASPLWATGAKGGYIFPRRAFYRASHASTASPPLYVIACSNIRIVERTVYVKFAII